LKIDKTLKKLLTMYYAAEDSLETSTWISCGEVRIQTSHLVHYNGWALH